MSAQVLLFLCTGNFYRSRYAEALFNHLALQSDLNWKARSKGFRPHLATELLSYWVVDRLEQEDIPRSLTRTEPGKVDVHDLAEASLVIALYEPEHAPMVKVEFPQWMNRIRYWQIPDLDITPPAIALGRIEHEVETLVHQLSAGHALGFHEDCVVEF
ncbi:MAG: hypothetical protein AAF491_06345 [Verrucomicrobiota bacterium]